MVSLPSRGKVGINILLIETPQTVSVQLSENANADVEKDRPSRSRGQECPLASIPVHTP